jgi:hypothetical protein
LRFAQTLSVILSVAPWIFHKFLSFAARSVLNQSTMFAQMCDSLVKLRHPGMQAKWKRHKCRYLVGTARGDPGRSGFGIVARFGLS